MGSLFLFNIDIKLMHAHLGASPTWNTIFKRTLIYLKYLTQVEIPSIPKSSLDNFHIRL